MSRLLTCGFNSKLQRDLIRTYGSGYGSGFTSRGVSGHPFPFYFWPVVWGGAALIAGEAYLDTRSEVRKVQVWRFTLAHFLLLRSMVMSTTARVQADLYQLPYSDHLPPLLRSI